MILIGIVFFVHFLYYFIRKEKSSSEVVNNDAIDLTSWVEETKKAYKAREKADPVDETVYLPIASSNKFRQPNTFRRYKKYEKYEKKETAKPSLPPEIIVKDINMTAADDLMKIKGIGKVYSERIIKYRDLLGGFSDMEQLNEVYGITLPLYEKIKERFVIQSPVKPLNLNIDSVKALIKHPYISYDLAWVIINYRKQHGDIESAEDLHKIRAMDDSLINKLKPYLRVR